MVGTFVVVGGIAPGGDMPVALAKDNKDKKSNTTGTATLEPRPGFGCGDENHIHTGPRGNAFGARRQGSPCRTETATTTTTTPTLTTTTTTPTTTTTTTTLTTITDITTVITDITG